MKRRHLFGATAALAALGLAGCRPEPAAPPDAARAAPEPQPRFTWTMLTAWPQDHPGLGSGATGFARRVAAMSGGRLSIAVSAAGERVPAQGVFDVVSRGSAELGHSAAYLWPGKTAAAPFFTAIPFGLSAAEMHAWLQHGGGMALWEEAYAPFGIKPLLVGNTGMRMGGWFNKEINSLQDFEALRVRMPGLGGEVLKRFAATTVTLDESEVPVALYNGTIDATDGGGPCNDLAANLHQFARFYYYPGWQAPQTAIELLINRKAWDALPADLQAIVEEAARGATQLMLDEYEYHNAQALAELRRQGVVLKRFPDQVLAALHHESEQVLEQLARQNELNGRIRASLQAFREQSGAMHRLAEKELYNWR
ncbi:TRAP transporter substrate-binding protein [Geopseudomonas aromaticivorans]